jgi:hypothetical protein
MEKKSVLIPRILLPAREKGSKSRDFKFLPSPTVGEGGVFAG